MAMSQSLYSFRCSSCDWKKFVSLTKANLPAESVDISKCPQCKSQHLSVISGSDLADLFMQLTKTTMPGTKYMSMA